jgi:hypothetical protein
MMLATPIALAVTMPLVSPTETMPESLERHVTGQPDNGRPVASSVFAVGVAVPSRLSRIALGRTSIDAGAPAGASRDASGEDESLVVPHASAKPTSASVSGQRETRLDIVVRM